MPDYLSETADGVILSLVVQPRSSKNQLAGCHDGALKVRLTAPPVDGAANKCCCAFLAKLLRVPLRDIEILSGVRSRHKRLLIHGLCQNDIIERLGAINDE
ncbi:DUF167 domain-containing protein [Pelovirga terrestris]|uniref:UPF0235 protein ICT70_02380 n=1 Tax=Pelovirga terrestris TaxID=2771352 RepID=A0A8J6QWU6_9BACT|nr:DUF167 domain-containing protein [Pelovirga terrestris]MBD1399507.1 YggU family protein [Pelovirga terrestris]